MSKIPTWILVALGLVLLIPLPSGSEISPPSAAVSLDSFGQSSRLCPALLPPSSPIVTVSSEPALRNQAYSAAPGTTILVEAGTYYRTRSRWCTTASPSAGPLATATM